MVALHARLAEDTQPVAENTFCWLRWMNDQRFAWLILVPKREVTEWHHLGEPEQHRLLSLTNSCASILEAALKPDKINVGALGNLVPQLHVHVIARRRDDACWPGPVWGNGSVLPYQGSVPAWLDQVRPALQALMDTP